MWQIGPVKENFRSFEPQSVLIFHFCFVLVSLMMKKYPLNLVNILLFTLNLVNENNILADKKVTN